jgi:hypothetical protein
MPPCIGLEGDRRLRCPDQVAMPPIHLPLRPRTPARRYEIGWWTGLLIEKWILAIGGAWVRATVVCLARFAGSNSTIHDPRSLIGALMVATDLTAFNPGQARPSKQSSRGHERRNFLPTDALAGLGPFVGVYRPSKHGCAAEIGLILTAAVAGLLSQIPGGELLDAVRSERSMVAPGVAMIGLSAGIWALWPSFPRVLTAQVVRGTAGGCLGSAVAAISLKLVGHAALARDWICGPNADRSRHPLGLLVRSKCRANQVGQSLMVA